MAIGKFKFEVYIDQLIKKAESIANNNKLAGKIIDKAFVKIGEASGRFVDMQHQSMAILRLLKAWYAREYTQVSAKSVVSLLASAIYIVNPIDIFPDIIPIIGRIDDKLVLGFFIKKLNDEIQKFMAWEELQVD